VPIVTKQASHEPPVPEEDLKRYFRKDTFARYVGIELMEVFNGRAKAVLEIREEHLNGLGMVHGGAVFTLADLACAAAANSKGRVAVAANASVSFLKSPKGRILTALAWEVSSSRALASYTVHVSDETGELLAVFQGLAYRRPEKTAEVFERG
jgi:acyl-CoA thioesterase